MKIKSIIALVLVLLMCLPFAAGCTKTSQDTTGDSEAPPATVNKETEVAENSTATRETFPRSDEDLFEDKNDIFNILLLGIDDINDLGISDTIMLLSVSKAQKKIKLVSFMEDTIVSIPGYTTGSLKMAYSMGGAKLVVNTVRHNFGVEIHRYALMNYFTFEDMVNVLGGVELTLTEQDIAYINDLMKENGQKETISAEAGTVTLNGIQALSYVRNCGGNVGGNTYEGDDFTRSEKQRAFIQAVIKKLGNTSADKLVEFANNIAPLVNTDLTMTEKSLFVANILTYLDYGIECAVVPFDSTWSYENDDKNQINVEDWSSVREKLESFVYGN